MGCGRERQAAAPPAPDGPPPPAGPLPAPAAPPGYAPYAAPAVPSPVAAFLARTAKGDWLSALKIAAWPTLTLLVLACLLGMFSTDDTDMAEVGWGVRMRFALALLLQSIGGGVTVAGHTSTSLVPLGDGFAGEASLSLVPLVVTALWTAMLVFAVRRAGRATAAAGAAGAAGPGTPAAGTAVPETVLRVAALCGVGTLFLGLLAQPSYAGVELSSSPWLALLCSFLLAAVVTGAVLARAETSAWLAARPAWHSAIAALRTALFALLTVVMVAGVVAFVTVLANADDIDGGQVVAMLVLLPNLGAMALAMAWGAPLNAEWNLPNLPFLDSGRQSIGYSEIGDLSGGWALFGVIVGGLAGALLVGLLVVRRSADRREQLLAAGFFVVALELLVLAAGASVTATFYGGGGDGYGNGPGYGDYYGPGGHGGGPSMGAHAELAAGGAETLLFALLWTFGAVLLAPYLLMIVGRGGPSAYPAPPAAAPPTATPTTAAPAAPVAPPAVTPAPASPPASAPTHTPTAPTTPIPTPTAPDLPPVQLGHPAPPPGATPPPASPEEPRKAGRRAVKWISLALAAFLVGGGAMAGALYFKNHQGGTDNKADKADQPAAAKSKQPATDAGSSPSPATTPTPTPAPTAGPTDGASSPAPGLPDGFVQKYDPMGFSVGVMDGWQRSQQGTQTDYRPPTGVAYLRIGVIPNAPQSSYENFGTLEKGAKKRTNYQRAELKRNTFQNSPGARWEFNYVNDNGNTIHAIDQAYVAADGTEYSIYYECLEKDWDAETDQVFSTALKTWSVSVNDVD